MELLLSPYIGIGIAVLIIAFVVTRMRGGRFDHVEQKDDAPVAWDVVRKGAYAGESPIELVRISRHPVRPGHDAEREARTRAAEERLRPSMLNVPISTRAVYKEDE